MNSGLLRRALYSRTLLIFGTLQQDKMNASDNDAKSGRSIMVIVVFLMGVLLTFNLVPLDESPVHTRQE